MRTKLVVLLGALALSLMAVWAAPAQAADQTRAFQGKVTGQVHFEPTTDPACTVVPLHTVSAATGWATHLGPVSMSASHCSGNTIAGTMTLSGIQGSVAFDYQGDCTPVPPVPETVTCDLTFVVAGGSGHFQDAQGQGNMTAVVHPDLSAPDPFQVPWPATWNWQGRIAY